MLRAGPGLEDQRVVLDGRESQLVDHAARQDAPAVGQQHISPVAADHCRDFRECGRRRLRLRHRLGRSGSQRSLQHHAGGLGQLGQRPFAHLAQLFVAAQSAVESDPALVQCQPAADKRRVDRQRLDPGGKVGLGQQRQAQAPARGRQQAQELLHHLVGVNHPEQPDPAVGLGLGPHGGGKTRLVYGLDDPAPGQRRIVHRDRDHRVGLCLGRPAGKDCEATQTVETHA